MSVSDAAKDISSQTHIFAAAPIPIIVLVALVSAAVWRILMWRYGGTIESLESRLKQRDDEMVELRRRLAEKPTMVERVVTIPPASDARKDAILQMQAALKNTAAALVASRVYDGLLAATPELKSAMLTGSKVFGLTPPPQRETPSFALDLGLWVREMLPLVRAGHIEEARARAVEIAEQLKRS